MSKKRFDLPFVMSYRLLPTPEPTDDSGEGSAQSQIPDPFPCNYQNWLAIFGTDENNNGSVDEADFFAWWVSNGFTEDQWYAAGNGPWPGNP